MHFHKNKKNNAKCVQCENKNKCEYRNVNIAWTIVHREQMTNGKEGHLDNLQADPGQTSCDIPSRPVPLSSHHQCASGSFRLGLLLSSISLPCVYLKFKKSAFWKTFIIFNPPFMSQDHSARESVLRFRLQHVKDQVAHRFAEP